VTEPGPAAIRLAPGLWQAMVEHALRERPLEACGLLAGRGDRAYAFYPTRNAARSPTRYDIDPQDLLRVTLELEARGEEVWGIFHSHPATPAYPSRTDVRLAFYPSAFYLICSTADPTRPVLRAFRIVDGAVSEVAVHAEDGGAGGRGSPPASPRPSAGGSP
jgi:proteasome lid subunit RPN8/RPN11